MSKTKALVENSFGKALVAKLKDYYILVKFRLSFTVVFSAAIGYAFAGGNINHLWLFSIAGFLITAASNALNQIIESDTDRLMTRTANRPLAAYRMHNTEAILVAGIMAVAGVGSMWYFFNTLAALLGALSLLSYAFIYTPSKKLSPIAVFVGAFPGAIPVIIGWVAATGAINQAALILCSIQFFWQFPHFWSIAWVAYDDYAKAGFSLLPSETGRTKYSAIHIITFTLILLPVSLLPYAIGMSGVVSAVITGICGLIFLYQTFKLYRTCDVKDARILMFYSFLYLPVVFIALLIDKL